VHLNGYFRATSLAKLGLVVQLNHRRGVCSNATIQTRGFTVYHTNGVHYISLSYCACQTHLAENSRVGQIFRQRWLPVTWKHPRTAFTFDCLNSFHLLNLQSKCNMYDYYSALLRLTDNGDIKDQPVRCDSALSYLLTHTYDRITTMNSHLRCAYGDTSSSLSEQGECTIQTVL
jgi:hypothetical protein